MVIKQTLNNSSPEGNTKTNIMGILRPFELDPFDLLWRDLFESNSRFSAITQKVTHPVDIYETEDGTSGTQTLACTSDGNCEIVDISV